MGRISFILAFVLVTSGLVASGLLVTSHAFAADPVIFADCQANLVSGVNTQIKLRSFNTTVAVIVPSVLNENISIVTYTLPTILRGLHMSEKTFDKKFAGKKVLLVGEGFGLLLPKLLSIGADATAIDPLYALKNVRAQVDLAQIADREPPTQTVQAIFDYIDRHGDRLVPGLSNDLPFAAASYDFVITHKVLNNFVKDQQVMPVYDYDLIRKSIAESVRMLKPGGQALHVFDESEEGFWELKGPNGFIDPAAYPGYDIQFAKPLPVRLRYSTSNGAYAFLNTLPDPTTHVLLTITAKK